MHLDDFTTAFCPQKLEIRYIKGDIRSLDVFATCKACNWFGFHYKLQVLRVWYNRFCCYVNCSAFSSGMLSPLHAFTPHLNRHHQYTTPYLIYDLYTFVHPFIAEKLFFNNKLVGCSGMCKTKKTERIYSSHLSHCNQFPFIKRYTMALDI